jgi:hypothetical protein
MLPAMHALELKAPAVSASSGASTALDITAYEGPVTILLAATAQGSGITNGVKVTHCDTSNGTFTDVAGGAFTGLSNTVYGTQALTLVADELKKFIKLDETVAGGTGTGIVGAQIVGAKKYR